MMRIFWDTAAALKLVGFAPPRELLFRSADPTWRTGEPLPSAWHAGM